MNFTPIPTNITPGLANAFGSTPLTEAPLAELLPIQALQILEHSILVTTI